MRQNNNTVYLEANNDALKSKIYEKWVPRIKKMLSNGLGDVNENLNISPKRLQQVALLCNSRMQDEMRRRGGSIDLSENATLANVNGHGPVVMGASPEGGMPAFYNGAKGSADVFQNLFGVFVEVAGYTVGMDLVPIVPMSKSQGTIYIAEPIYAGGKLDNAANKPAIVHVKQIKTGAAPALVIGTTYTLTEGFGGANVIDVTYIGQHRINGNFVFRVGQQYGAYIGQVVKDAFDSVVSNQGIYTSAVIHWTFDASTVDLLAGLSNFTTGYSGAGNTDSLAWFLNRQDGSNYSENMNRGTGETTYYRSLGIRTWSRHFSAGTVQAEIEYTTEQIQDMQMDHGMDALSFGDSILSDQLMQHMNDHILSRIFALGWEHHYQINQANGRNMNLYLSDTGSGSARTYRGKDNTTRTIGGPAAALPNSAAIAENMSTLQRRVVSRLLHGSKVINSRSRRGKGDTAVLNTTFATAIQDVQGFAAAPFENNIDSSGVTYLGTLYGINIYEDPVMDSEDPRIAIFRKGNEKDPGIKMCPFLLAEKISTIAEGTMAPKEALKSRYSLVEAGSEPQLNYLTFAVETGSGFGIV